MRFQAPYSPELFRLLDERAQRRDLLDSGFDIDDATLARHRDAARQYRHHTPEEKEALAIYAALFDKSAPHNLDKTQPVECVSAEHEQTVRLINRIHHESKANREVFQSLIESHSAKHAEVIASIGLNAREAAIHADAMRRVAVQTGAQIEQAIVTASAAAAQLHELMLAKAEAWRQSYAIERERVERNARRFSIARLILLALALIALCAQKAHCQAQSPLVIRGQNAGSTLFNRTAGLLVLNCSTNMTCTWSAATNTLTLTASGSGTTPRQPTPFFSSWGATTGAANKGLSHPAGGCSTSAAQNLWPVAGYLANPVATTSTANAQIGFRANIAQDCAYGSAPSPGGVVVPPGAAAGAYADTLSIDQWHLEQNAWYAGASAKIGSNSSATTAALNVLAFAFTDDAGLYQTVIGGGDNGHTPTAATTTYINLQGSEILSTTEKPVAIPMPFAGTLGTFSLCLYSTVPTGGSQTYAISKSGTLQSTIITQLATDPAFSCYNVSPNVSFVAGDYLSFAVTTPTTGGAISQWAAAIYPSSGTGSIVAAVLDASVSTTQVYYAPGSGLSQQTAIAAGQAGMPISCLAKNLYVVLAGAQSGTVTTTFTVYRNGSATGITGSIAPSTAAGALALDTTHSQQFNVGDTLSFSAISTGGGSATLGGVSLQCN